MPHVMSSKVGCTRGQSRYSDSQHPPRTRTTLRLTCREIGFRWDDRPVDHLFSASVACGEISRNTYFYFEQIPKRMRRTWSEIRNLSIVIGMVVFWALFDMRGDHQLDTALGPCLKYVSGGKVAKPYKANYSLSVRSREPAICRLLRIRV